MDKGYIVPEAALKKLRVAKGLGQTVYIYGATGYEKTELVKQYLSRRRYRYISCAEDAAGLTETAQSAGEEKGGEPRSVVVADDLHLLKDAQGSRAVLSLAGSQDIWLILICRSPIPAWLKPLYIKGGFLVITEDDLRFGEKEISAITVRSNHSIKGGGFLEFFFRRARYGEDHGRNRRNGVWYVRGTYQ